MRLKSTDQFIAFETVMRYNLKRVRLKFDLTQMDVANGIKCTRGMYTSIENGNAKPSIERLMLIREYYKKFFNETLSMDFLFGISDKPQGLISVDRSVNFDLKGEITFIKESIAYLLNDKTTVHEKKNDRK